jgi:hypothetical protein
MLRAVALAARLGVHDRPAGSERDPRGCVTKSANSSDAQPRLLEEYYKILRAWFRRKQTFRGPPHPLLKPV